MNKRLLLCFSLTIMIVLFACDQSADSKSVEKWKQEIMDVELAFAAKAKCDGLHKAFTFYAAEDAVLMRRNSLIIGKYSIDSIYRGQDVKGLDWTPDYVDVANSGDMGYTYGHYTFTYLDSSNLERIDEGVFHTVWKRQDDGSWKFVWD